MFAARLVAYEPGGVRLGVLPEPLEWDASFALNDHGALVVKYSLHALGADILARNIGDGLEIAVEVGSGSFFWAEPANGRFIWVRDDSDELDPNQVITLTCPSISTELTYARIMSLAGLLPASHSQAGLRPFYNASAGKVLGELLAENREQGGIHLAAGFDERFDSAGAPWALAPTFYLEPGKQFSEILTDLTNKGLCDWTTTGRFLWLYNPDTALNQTTDITLRLGDDISEAPTTRTLEDVAARVLLRSNTGLAYVMENPAAPAPYGKAAQYITPANVTDTITAQLEVSAELSKRGRVTAQYTRKLNLTPRVPTLFDLEPAGKPVPFVDYRVGDWITAPTTRGRAEQVRIQQITLSYNGEGFTGSLVLNDRILDAELRRARRFQTLTGGSTTGGLVVATPGIDTRTPTAPAGLAVVSGAHIDEAGAPVGTITATWEAVTHATDGSLMEIVGYELWVKRTGLDWQPANLAVETTAANYGPLTPRETVAVRVRARGRFTTTPGVWSQAVTVTVEDDTTPPPPPAALTVASTPSGFIVTWGGKTLSNGNMPADFAGLNVHLEGQPEPVGWLTLAGQSIFIQLPTGTTDRVRGVAEDRSGNLSEPGPWSNPQTV
jgi:hypothetical protein